LLARKQKQKDTVSEDCNSENESDVGNDTFNDINSFQASASTPKTIANIRPSVLKSPMAPQISTSQPGQIRGTIAAPRSTLSQAVSRSTLLNAQQSINAGNDSNAFSQSRTEELLGQYALAEKNKHLKKIKDDNDKLAAVLKVVLITLKQNN
jgi:hypothetical protein